MLRSRGRASATESPALTVDGPSLIYRSPGKPPRYLLHTARTPWTQQLAADCLVAEVLVQQLAPEQGASDGLVLGVTEPGCGTEPLTHWPGTARGRWLWRSDGIAARATTGEQRSVRWRFGPGDKVGFAVGRSHVSFIRNGERVHTVPRYVRSEAAPPSPAGAPVLTVGLGCDAVLRLCEGAQYLHLCSYAEPSGSPVTQPLVEVSNEDASGAGHRDALDHTTCRRRFRRCVWAVQWVARVIAATLQGPPVWGQLVLPEPAHVVTSARSLWTASASCSRHDQKGLLGQVGGERFLKEIISNAWKSEQLQLGTEDVVEVDELCVNQLEPAEAESFTTALVSARLRRKAGTNGTVGGAGAFRQARLQRQGTSWTLNELLCDGSGTTDSSAGVRRLAQTSEDVDGHAKDECASTLGSSRASSRLPASRGARGGTPSNAQCAAAATGWATEGASNSSPLGACAAGGKGESQAQLEAAIEAARAVFRGLDRKMVGHLCCEDLEPVFAGARHGLFQRLDHHGKGHICCDDWLQFCRELEESRGVQGLKQFLQACAQSLAQRRRPREAREDCDHPWELPAELSLVSNAYGWRVEAKPVTLSDEMLERIGDKGLQRFRQQAAVAHALLGQDADEAIIELADRIALQQGNHDDCWAKMLSAGEWSRAQPSWTKQAIAHAKLSHLDTATKLQQVLAWALAEGKPLKEAFQPPLAGLAGLAEKPEVEDLWQAAIKGVGNPVEASAAIGETLLAGESLAPLEAVVDTTFHNVVGSMLHFRFLILLELNWSVGRDFLPLIDLGAPADSAYGRLLAQVKPRLLGHLKFAQFQQVLQSTKYDGAAASVILNRKAAVSLRERGRVDWEFRRSLTGQLMAELRRQSIGPKLFRRPWQSRCMKVQFKGEGGEDAGGLYREALDAVAQELHSRTVPLLVPCPNAVAEVGDNRDTWLLNPRATSIECMRALEFVGQLLGLALRTGDLLPLALAPFTWKGIVGDERRREDIRSIDIFADKHLAMLSSEQKPDEPGEGALAAMGGLQFVYPDITGEEVELVEGGRDITVTAENASEFALLLLQSRIAFDTAQLQALRRGLATVVPIQLLRLWSWRDLQERVCGISDVDLENLKRHTTYKNCNSASAHVGYLWEALESFTQKQRRSFLRFVWGRSSLPTVEKWERNFTVQLLSGTDDTRLPCSHTCFFTLDLPTFSGPEVCRAKLLYCVTHCLAIDADGAPARALNWDEDDED